MSAKIETYCQHSSAMSAKKSCQHSMCHVSKTETYCQPSCDTSGKQRRPVSACVPCQQNRDVLQRSICIVSKRHQVRGMGRVGAIGRVGLSLLPVMWSSGNKTSVRLRTPRYRERERERGVRVGEEGTEGR
jgi:hypothetical protein